jgi:hypothetical protein
MKIKKLFITLTVGVLWVIMVQSCNNIEPQIKLMELNVEHISRSGIDTSATNIDTLTKNIDTTSTTK